MTDFLISYKPITGIIAGGFPGGSEGKESAYSAGDLCSIPGLGRSPGEGNGNPLQYSCLKNPMDRGAWQATYSPQGQASLVAHTVKNPPAMWDTWAQSLGWEDALEEEGMATHSSILAWRTHGDRCLVGYSPWGCRESDTTEATKHGP